MKLEKNLQDDVMINLEVERIKLLFEKNNYNLKQKKWFIEAKEKNATKEKSEIILNACRILNEELNTYK